MSYERVVEAFLAASVLPPESAARNDLLARLFPEDPSLRDEVLALLRQHDSPSSPIDVPLVDARRALDSIAAPQLRDFHIVRLLGEGGMGEVYLARQQKPDRLVALKMMRAGVVTPARLRRFEIEQETLARLRHPGIAQIYAAGIAEGSGTDAAGRGRPYFAMEYIDGLSLIEHATALRRGVEARIELAIQVCDAVQHAHQRGVIHRDLKPSNILVRRRDEEVGDRACDEAIVLDFGIARVVGADHGLTTAPAGAVGVLGTLPYMSPEQIEGGASQLDTRSDVYALGVILYELLSGRPPHDFAGTSLPVAARIIREVAPTPLRLLDRRFRGDLDVIVAKAMSKERERRYQSAAALAADLRRSLTHEAIEARRDSSLYLLRAALCRHRAAAASAIAIVALLVLATGVLFVSARRLSRLAADEAAARRSAEDATTALRQQIAANVVERGRLLGRLGNLKGAEQLIWPEMRRTPDSRLASWALWELYVHHPVVAILGEPDVLGADDALPGANPPEHGTLNTGGLGTAVDQGDGGVPRTEPTREVGAASERAVQAWAAAFSPDDRLLATGAGDGRIRIYSTDGWRCLAVLDAHMGEVHALRFSPDGRTLASSGDGLALLWSIADQGFPSGAARRLEEHRGLVSALCFSPDGRTLATGGADGWLRRWSVENGDLIDAVAAHGRRIECVQFDPSGTMLASASWDGTVTLWNDLMRGPVATLKAHRGLVNGLAFTADGRTLASSSSDRSVRLWDVATHACIDTLTTTAGALYGLRFSPDGQRLVAGTWWSVEQWDLQSRTRSELASVGAIGEALTFSSDGRWFTTGSDPRGLGPVRVWAMPPGPARIDLCDHARRVSLDAGHAGLATLDEDGVIRLWTLPDKGGAGATSLSALDMESDAGRARDVARLPGAQLICLDPTGTHLATVATDGAIRISRLDNGAAVGGVGHGRAITADAMAFAPDGRHLAALRDDRTISLLSVPECVLVATVARAPQAGELVSVAFDPQGGAIACGLRKGPISIRSPRGEPLQELAPSDGSWCLAYSGDGGTIASGTWLGTIELWDVRSSVRRHTLVGHHALVRCVAFSMTNRDLLASASADGTVRLWDTPTGQCLVTLTPFDGGSPTSLAFTADGQWLLAGGESGGVVGWRLRLYLGEVAGWIGEPSSSEITSSITGLGSGGSGGTGGTGGSGGTRVATQISQDSGEARRTDDSGAAR